MPFSVKYCAIDDSYMVSSDMMVIIVSDLYTNPLKSARSAR